MHMSLTVLVLVSLYRYLRINLATLMMLIIIVQLHYRVTPVISKLFEKLLLNLCDSALASDELQFGFKRHVWCENAIFTLKSTREYF